MVPLAAQTVITCTITGLSQDATISWLGPDNNEISTSDTNNYVINQGSYFGGSKASTLTIFKAKLGTLSSDVNYSCKVKSALYSDSPEVTKAMTLTILEFGKFLLFVTEFNPMYLIFDL